MSLVVLTAVPHVKDGPCNGEVHDFCGPKKVIDDFQCWISTELRGDVLTCHLNIINYTKKDIQCCIRGLDIVQDLDRMRSREFIENFELRSFVETRVVLFFERVVSTCCPVAVVLNIFDHTRSPSSSVDFENPKLPHSNVCLNVGDKKIYAHREYMAFCSPVFDAMFSCYFIEGSEEDVKLYHINPTQFLNYMHVMYHNFGDINNLTVRYLLDLADQFDTSCVKKKCEDYLILNVPFFKDYVAILKMCHQFQLVRLQARIQSANLKSLVVIHTNEQKIINKFLDMSLKLVDKKKSKIFALKFPYLDQYSVPLTKPVASLANDIIFQVNNVKVYGDRKILSIFSPVLKELFETTETNIITIDNVNFPEFHHLLSLLFHTVDDSQRLNAETVVHILKLAKRFDIQVLLEECRRYLISYDGYILKYKDALELANEHDFADVREHIFKRMAQLAMTLRSLTAENCFDSMPLSSFAIEESYSFLKKWCD